MELAFETKLGRLYLGDAKDAAEVIKPDSLDLIITDPPYPKQYLPCFSYLAQVFPPLMKSGASLLTICGHYELAIVMLYFLGHLKFRWIFCLDQSMDKHARMALGIEVMWKPMLWYVKDKFPKERNYGFMRDMIKVNNKEKDLHPWQQSVTWCHDIIQKLTKSKELVCDPFVGSGTSLVACENLNRRWIGIDNDKMAIDTTIERLKQRENTRIV